MKLKFEWVRKEGQYQSGETLGETLLVNKTRLAEYYWDSTGSRDDPNRTTLSGRIYLPALKEAASNVHDNDADVIKEKIEGVVTRWFKRVLKEEE